MPQVRLSQPDARDQLPLRSNKVYPISIHTVEPQKWVFPPPPTPRLFILRPTRWLLTVRLDPPSDFYWPTVDLIGDLGNISKNLSTGHYTSQYDLDIDVAKVWASGHDGHFHTATCTSGGISFERPVYLISVSQDGLKDPLIYVYGMQNLRSKGTQEHGTDRR